MCSSVMKVDKNKVILTRYKERRPSSSGRRIAWEHYKYTECTVYRQTSLKASIKLYCINLFRLDYMLCMVLNLWQINLATRHGFDENN